MMLISMSKVKYFHVAIYSSPSLLDERPETSKRRVVTRTKWVVAEEFTTQSLEESRKEYGESFGLIGRPRKAGTLFSFYSQ